MSLITLTYFSPTLGGYTQTNVALPVGMEYEALLEPGEKFQTLWLLHGGGGNFSEWESTGNAERMCLDHKLAVVMPEGGGHSMYCDLPDGRKYYTYLTEDLPNFLRKHLPLSDKREDNFIAGLSMGSGGAAKIAFNNPDKFAAVGIFSGGPSTPFSPNAARRTSPERRDFMIKYVYGSEESIPGSIHDIDYVLKKAVADGVKLPMIFGCCGIQDGAIVGFRQFKDKVLNLGLPGTFHEVEGVHSWDVWSLSLEKFCEWLPYLKYRNFWRKWYDNKPPRN